MYSECAAHICGLSNFEEICNGPVRPHLQSSVACISMHDWTCRPPVLQLLRLCVALHLQYIPDTAACARCLRNFEKECSSSVSHYMQNYKACTSVRDSHQLLPLLVTLWTQCSLPFCF